MTLCNIVATAISLPGVSDLTCFISSLQKGSLSFDKDIVEIPVSDLLPARLKRRMSRLIQMTISTTHDARTRFPLSDDVPLIFGSANGEINTIGSVLNDVFRDQPLVSPSAFHNSVHNSAPGYWSILTKLHHASTTISADDLTFGYSMLQACSMLSCDLSNIQVTIGDEKIEVPWADPSHVSIDFCASLIVSNDSAFRPIGRILDVRHVTSRDELLHMITTDHPTEIFADYLIVPDAKSLKFSDHHRNPCSALFHLMVFLHSPEQSGRIMLIEGNLSEGCVAIVVEKT